MNVSDLKSQKPESSTLYSLYIKDDTSEETDLINFLSGVTSCNHIQIQMGKLKHLPDAFRHIDKLERIKFEGNGIKTIDPGIFSQPLQQFSFKSNILESIPDALWESDIRDIYFTTENLVDQNFKKPNRVHDQSRNIGLDIQNLRELPSCLSSFKIQSLRLKSDAISVINPGDLSTHALTSVTISGKSLVTVPNLGDAKSLYYVTIASEMPLNLSNLTLPASVQQLQLAGNPLKLPELAQLQQLNNLSLQGVKGDIGDAVGKCKELKHLRIYQSGIDGISESITNCQHLAELSIISSLTSLPPNILKISSLHTLQLQDNHITTLDADWSALKGLKNLSLSHNNANISSLNFINDLPKLENVNLNGNKLANRYVFINKKKIPLGYAGDMFGNAKATQKEILAFGAALGKLTYNKETLHGFFDHFWNTGELLSYCTVSDERICQALNIAYPPLKVQLHTYFEEEYLRKFNGLDSVDSDSSVYVEGKTIQPLNKIKETLQSLNIKYAAKLTENVTHIVVGKNPELAEAFNRDKYLYISESDIFDLAEKHSPKFLNEQVSQGNADILTSVSSFLLSSEAANVKIGLQMLATGGVPDEILDLVLMLAKSSDDTSVRAEAKKILQISAPPSWKLLIDDKQLFKNLNTDDAKEQDIYNKLKTIAANAGAEAAAILSLVLYRRYKKGLRYVVLTNTIPEPYKKQFHEMIIENGHMDFATALGFKSWKGYAPQDMTLNTYKIKYKLPTDALASHTITSLNLHNCKLTAAPKEIVEFKDVKSIDLSCNNLTTLPAYFAQLQELEDLDLSSNNLTEFPLVLTKLKNLRKLNLQHNRKDHQIISIAIPEEIKAAMSACEILS